MQISLAFDKADNYQINHIHKCFKANPPEAETLLETA